MMKMMMKMRMMHTHMGSGDKAMLSPGQTEIHCCICQNLNFLTPTNGGDVSRSISIFISLFLPVALYTLPLISLLFLPDFAPFCPAIPRYSRLPAAGAHYKAKELELSVLYDVEMKKVGGIYGYILHHFTSASLHMQNIVKFYLKPSKKTPDNIIKWNCSESFALALLND